jgi:hypothetical protein
VARTLKVKRAGTGFAGFEKYELDKVHLAERLVRGLYEKDPDATLKEVSKRAQIAVSTLQKLNSGKTLFPRFDTLWKMATAAGIEVILQHKEQTPARVGRSR